MPYGNFGKLSSEYSQARKEYPDEVIGLLISHLSQNAYVLDLGCGTGISTRQIADRANVSIVGSDADPLMIAEAQKWHDNLKYSTAAAEALPFSDKAFDAVTAFGAFHWFANKKAMAEIRRVLKSEGIFFVVNKNEAGDFEREHKAIMRPFMAGEPSKVKSGYAPEQLLKDEGFGEITVLEFPTSEYFNSDELQLFFQSISAWSKVQSDQKPLVLELLRAHFEPQFANGTFERKLIVRVVEGKNSAVAI